MKNGHPHEREDGRLLSLNSRVHPPTGGGHPVAVRIAPLELLTDVENGMPLSYLTRKYQLAHHQSPKQTIVQALRNVMEEQNIARLWTHRLQRQSYKERWPSRLARHFVIEERGFLMKDLSDARVRTKDVAQCLNRRRRPMGSAQGSLTDCIRTLESGQRQAFLMLLAKLEHCFEGSASTQLREDGKRGGGLPPEVAVALLAWVRAFLSDLFNAVDPDRIDPPCSAPPSRPSFKRRRTVQPRPCLIVSDGDEGGESSSSPRCQPAPKKRRTQAASGEMSNEGPRQGEIPAVRVIAEPAGSGTGSCGVPSLPGTPPASIDVSPVGERDRAVTRQTNPEASTHEADDGTSSPVPDSRSPPPSPVPRAVLDGDGFDEHDMGHYEQTPCDLGALAMAHNGNEEEVLRYLSMFDALGTEESVPEARRTPEETPERWFAGSRDRENGAESCKAAETNPASLADRRASETDDACSHPFLVTADGHAESDAPERGADAATATEEAKQNDTRQSSQVPTRPMPDAPRAASRRRRRDDLSIGTYLCSANDHPLPFLPPCKDMVQWNQKPQGRQRGRRVALFDGGSEDAGDQDNDFSPSRAGKGRPRREAKRKPRDPVQDLLLSSCSHLCDVDLKRIVSHETWGACLEDTDRNRLLLLLPGIDRADEQSLRSAFSDPVGLRFALQEYQGLQKQGALELGSPRLLPRTEHQQPGEDEIDVNPYSAFDVKPPELTEENLGKLRFRYTGPPLSGPSIRVSNNLVGQGRGRPGEELRQTRQKKLSARQKGRRTACTKINK